MWVTGSFQLHAPVTGGGAAASCSSPSSAIPLIDWRQQQQHRRRRRSDDRTMERGRGFILFVVLSLYNSSKDNRKDQIKTRLTSTPLVEHQGSSTVISVELRKICKLSSKRQQMASSNTKYLFILFLETASVLYFWPTIPAIILPVLLFVLLAQQVLLLITWHLQEKRRKARDLRIKKDISHVEAQTDQLSSSSSEDDNKNNESDE